MNPPINFLPWRQQRRTAFLRFWLLMFVAPLLLVVGITLILRLTGSAEARIDAVLLQAEQQLARSLQITKPRLLEQQQLREQRSQRQRQRQFTRDWQSALEALAALLPEHAWLTTISWQQEPLEIKADNKHYRVKRTRNVTPPGCVFSSQSAGSHAAGCAGTLAI